MVGELIDKLDDLRITDNTIVIYSTDNGAEIVSWPDGGCAPFHGEKGMGRRASGAAPPALVSSSRAHRSTRSSPTTTGCRHFSRPPVSRTSKRSCSSCDESWIFASPSPLILIGLWCH
jgi:Sulfatase